MQRRSMWIVTAWLGLAIAIGSWPAGAEAATVVALGAGDLLVGLSDYCPLEDPVDPSIARVGTSITPSWETLVRLRPDLQIGTGAALMRKSVRDGWTCVGPTAAKFVEKYADLLPLTV